MVSFFFTVQDICLEVITELPSSAISVPTQKLLVSISQREQEIPFGN